MQKQTEIYMKQNHMTGSGDGVLVGLSGGADSVGLLLVLWKLRETFQISLRALHVHHGLRGAEADRDAAFSRMLCERLEVPFYEFRIDAAKEALDRKCSVEEAGRQARYRLYEETALAWEEEMCPDLTSENAGEKEAAAARVHIATAHHADDNAETVLFNLFRGSGLTGLSGIAPVRGRIIRPLLWAQRSEIQTWLRQQGQDWVEDSTNQESEYSRNWLRNELLPAVEERLNAQAVRHIDQAGRRIRQADAYLEEVAEEWLQKHAPDGKADAGALAEQAELSPHYYCPNCHYYDFDSEEVKKYSGMAGCDMQDKECPVCGHPLTKDGFDIPFETFLGFKGDKEPDIDLNFSGEYQSKAHDYTEVIFGKGQTFRAGTIGTLADKTAYGYVKNYYEEHGVHKRNCEINRIVQGCVGVRRTTGQHPGGIIVLPHGEEIYSFTPVQRPANDMTTMTVTTHFDYHSIDHNLLKLDILGHDDPTMIRMLQDLIGFDPVKDIPLDSREVMSLFQDTSALGITPDDIGGCKLGALGVPEFGTDFAMQMLIDTQPKYFSDLVRIAGLAHGTDVWLGNAQTLIQEGKATIQTAICTRDDIMIYLISMGLEEGLSFTIMESVRKGKGLKPEWEEEMTSHGVPDWYIWSCKKIKYMFPKAHAAAYVMMAWRIAYCKVFYPLAYYAAFFSIRASGFSYELMCQGRDKLEYYLADYRKRMDTLSKKEQDTLRDMRIVQEMYARGYDFTPIDIYQAKARHFQIIGGKLMPSLSSIDGLGEKAADAVVDAVKDGRFLSKEDFRNRTKVSKTVCDLMGDLGLLGELPESNQLSLFDF